MPVVAFALLGSGCLQPEPLSNEQVEACERNGGRPNGTFTYCDYDKSPQEVCEKAGGGATDRNLVTTNLWN